MGRIRTVAVLPTLFTLGNLVCGFFAIVVASRIQAPASTQPEQAPAISTINPVKAFKAFDPTEDAHNIILAGWLIFLAMLFDALDGHLARLAGSSSDFGAQLDSLCDLVTFGVAPALLLVKMCPGFAFQHREEVWVIAASFAACAAMRLARFNAETGEDDDHLHFSGLPSPAAAASIASFGILFYAVRKEDSTLLDPSHIDTILQTVLPLFAVLVSVLMVSRVPYPHIVNQVFSGQRSLGHIVAVVFALVAAAAIRRYSVPLLCALFVFSGPSLYIWQEYFQKRPHKEPLF